MSRGDEIDNSHNELLAREAAEVVRMLKRDPRFSKLVQAMEQPETRTKAGTIHYQKLAKSLAISVSALKRWLADARERTVRPARSRYLSPDYFTWLFLNPACRRKQIMVAMFVLAQGVARRFKFHDLNDRADMISQTAMKLIDQARKFDVAHGSSAFSYFTSVARNSYAKLLVDSVRRRVLQLGEDVTDSQEERES